MRKPKQPTPPKPYDLFMIVRRVGKKEIVPVYAHSGLQAITFYVHGIDEPWREKEFTAELLESPAKRQPKSYRTRFAKYQAKLAVYELLSSEKLNPN